MGKSIKIMDKSIKIILLAIVFLILWLSGFFYSNSVVAADEKEVHLYYFYINVCGKCKDAQDRIDYYIDMLRDANPSVPIRFFDYNIAETNNLELFKSYCKTYKMNDEQCNAPVLFAGGSFFSGEDEIEKGIAFINETLAKGDLPQTLKIDDGSLGSLELKKGFIDLKLVNVLGAGLINGLNPCSLSMLLFLLSLLFAGQEIKVIKIGMAFITGKFIAYLLLGTLLFSFFSKIDMNRYEIFLKIVMGVFITFMVFLNIKDIFTARKGEYGNIKNQLPEALRKMNHGLISKIKTLQGGAILVIAGLILGVVISVGEFLCTGQVYLASIVYIYQSETSLSLRALSYLTVYSFAFIIPALAVVLIISKTRKLMMVSEFMRKRLPLIKALTALILVLTGIVTLFYI